MKKLASNLQRITLVLSLLFIGFGLTACSDDDEDGGSFIGTWRSEWRGKIDYKHDYNEYNYQIYTFNADGTGLYQEGRHSGEDSTEKIYSTITITWTYSDGEITINKLYDNGHVFSDTVPIRVSGNAMELDDLDYVRIK